MVLAAIAPSRGRAAETSHGRMVLRRRAPAPQIARHASRYGPSSQAHTHPSTASSENDTGHGDHPLRWLRGWSPWLFRCWRFLGCVRACAGCPARVLRARLLRRGARRLSRFAACRVAFAFASVAAPLIAPRGRSPSCSPAASLTPPLLSASLRCFSRLCFFSPGSASELRFRFPRFHQLEKTWLTLSPIRTSLGRRKGAILDLEPQNQTSAARGPCGPCAVLSKKFHRRRRLFFQRTRRPPPPPHFFPPPHRLTIKTHPSSRLLSALSPKNRNIRPNYRRNCVARLRARVCSVPAWARALAS